ncbi:PREDICTED: snRNA-activating protein complex subunit 2 [Elephantulus edwardii]|uniref:snRNA-activating protein complex subunit 2 n=1 Tax=Elephantulus edwardii TaxID=28737 RepID=UPI0003F0E634|nr:PREDICTED: snRNA-activating protein complex subunit 2 [Elephantulus edwardii]
MRPPKRLRAPPSRYLGAAASPAAWSIREKRQLLRLLQAQRGQPKPDVTELARGLPGRSEDEIHHFIQQLKSRVAREAIQKLYPSGQRRQPPAPIEVWTDLAGKITDPVEDALTAAFSQVFTIAATEPLSLMHSVPPKPTQARGKPLLLSAPQGRETTDPEAPAPAPANTPAEPPAGSASEIPFTVDFEKIYKYLAALSRSGSGPELSAAESSVILDLLLSLPEELTRLPCTALADHMTGAYQRLTTRQPGPGDGTPGPETEDGGSGSRGHEEPSQATPKIPARAGPNEPQSPWQAAGVCPLNPFLVPLELLCQRDNPAS